MINILTSKYLLNKVSEFSIQIHDRVGLGRKIKANCSLVGPGSMGGVHSVEVFLRDPSPYSEFPRKTRKTPND